MHLLKIIPFILFSGTVLKQLFSGALKKLFLKTSGNKQEGLVFWMFNLDIEKINKMSINRVILSVECHESIKNI